MANGLFAKHRNDGFSLHRDPPDATGMVPVTENRPALGADQRHGPYASTVTDTSVTLTYPVETVPMEERVQQTAVPGLSALKISAASQANSTTSPVDSTELAQLVHPGSRWVFRACGLYTAAAATTGIGVGVNGPAGSTVAAHVVIDTTATAKQNGVVRTLGGTVLGTTSLGATELGFEVEGTITVGPSGGLLAVCFRSEVAGSAVTLQPGSSLRAWT